MDILANRPTTVLGRYRLFIQKLGFLVLVFFSSSLHSEGFSFGLLAKNIHDRNFQEAWRGCQDYAESVSAQCLLFGPDKSTTPRDQVLALETALNFHHLDALAVSVLHSKQLANFVQNMDIPVFSYGSPFDEQFKHLSQSYVGINKYVLGKELGSVARSLYPDGGVYCILTAKDVPNIEQRAQGVRNELKDKKWREAERCPWNNNESSSQALKQTRVTLLSIQPDVLISLGDWPISNNELYREMLDELFPASKERKTQIVIASGHVEEPQWKLLNEGYLDAIVSIDFYLIGWAIAHHMYQHAVGTPVVSDENITINKYVRNHQ